MFLLIAAVIILFVTGGNNKEQKKLDERITLRKNDKLPYGTYVANTSLPFFFPEAAVYTNRSEPGFWDSISVHDSNQVLIIITAKLNADEEEMKKLIDFTRNGNDVFISAVYLSAAADRLLKCSSSSYDMNYISVNELHKPFQLSLSDQPFGTGSRYAYPGRTFNSYYTELDTVTTDVLGYDERKRSNFIHLSAGKGHLYVQLEPLAFSNYFLLYHDNIGYLEKVFSLLNPHAKKVVWDEYYLHKRSDNGDKQQSWISVLFRYPALKAALLTAILALVVYVLMEMRRKQRVIPYLKKPKNDSLDFVKTIGRLYYDKGDHLNLCRKMSAYFLEHIRTQYKLPTGVLDDAFISHLHFKSGVEKSIIQEILSFIQYLDKGQTISDKQLTGFHKQLASFYTKA